MKLSRFPQADRDLDAIWDYIAQFDPGAAKRQIARIVASYARLADYPTSAPAAPEWGEGIRSLICDRYRILHIVGPDSVDIIRVVHQARAVRRLLDRD